MYKHPQGSQLEFPPHLGHKHLEFHRVLNCIVYNWWRHLCFKNYVIIIEMSRCGPNFIEFLFLLLTSIHSFLKVFCTIFSLQNCAPQIFSREDGEKHCFKNEWTIQKYIWGSQILYKKIPEVIKAARQMPMVRQSNWTLDILQLSSCDRIDRLNCSIVKEATWCMQKINV